MIWHLPSTVIILSIIPSALISIYVISVNEKDKERIFLYIKMMLLGALSVLPGVILVTLTTTFLSSGLLSTLFIRPFIAVALVEELIKLSLIALILYRNKRFRTTKDGIYYSIAIAVGFALAENIIYLTGSTGYLKLIVSRSLTAVPIHAICGAYMGYFTGLGKELEKGYFAPALLTALLIHGLYNVLITLNFPYYLFSIILIIISLVILKLLYNKNRVHKGI